MIVPAIIVLLIKHVFKAHPCPPNSNLFDFSTFGILLLSLGCFLSVDQVQGDGKEYKFSEAERIQYFPPGMIYND